MASEQYPRDRTALLLIDPYNDFLSEGGKMYAAAKAIIDEVDMLAHMRAIVSAARDAGVRIFYVPHHRSQPSDFAGWNYITPYQQGGDKLQLFAVGTWGAEWHPDFIPRPGDVMIKEHWSSGFASTDLDLQLKQHGVDKIVLIGMVANTCLESTGRYGMELGYHVTLVRDATAAFSREAMHASHEVNGPTFAHAIVNTDELIAALPPPAP